MRDDRDCSLPVFWNRFHSMLPFARDQNRFLIIAEGLPVDGGRLAGVYPRLGDPAPRRKQVMLGEMIGEMHGQTSTRVLPDEGHGPRMEVTDQASGTLCGVAVNQTVTYVGTMRPNGLISGAGTGVTMTTNGGAATFRGVGVGRFVGQGALSWRGALFYETASEELARLNGIAALFEYEVDASGKTEGRFYEWK